MFGFSKMNRLRFDQRGAAMPVIGMAMLALVGATGSAIDMSRAELVQSKLSTALDAAGLAAGATVHSNDVSTEARNYFDANFPAGYMGSTVTSFAATPNSDSTLINLSASATVNTNFMRIFGKRTVSVSATSEITRENKGMELVLVLDTTGSMNNAVNSSNSAVTKIAALKSAVGDLMDILYGTNTTLDNVWVGVVPFSQTVNIGTGRSSWTTNNSYDWGNQSWDGCVTARPSPNDISDAVPTGNLFGDYYYPTSGTISTPVTGTGVNGSCGNGSGWNGWKCTVDSTSNHVTTHTLTYDYSYNSSVFDNKGPNQLCPQAVTPMTKTKATVVNAVNSLTAAGDTVIDLGLAWGWRMLSPNWQNLWGGEMNTDHLPLAYNTALMNKVVILMTDGMNHFLPNNYSAYGYLSDNQLGSTNETNAETELDNRTLAVCNSLKSNGVIVYTIGFGTNSGSTAVNSTLLQACASKPEYYFYSPTNTDLQSAFHQIGDSLANLRISK